MPVLRYFLFVGGVLLALLYISSAWLPASPEMTTANADVPLIRIHSDRKWPEPVVFDTKIAAAAPVPVQTAKTEVVAPVADMSTKVRVRDAFAQLPFDPKLEAADAKKPEPKLPPKRKVAKRHVAPPTMQVAQQPQQPQFGFFANNSWSPQFTR
jgi:hypothetical protein